MPLCFGTYRRTVAQLPEPCEVGRVLAEELRVLLARGSRRGCRGVVDEARGAREGDAHDVIVADGEPARGDGVADRLVRFEELEAGVALGRSRLGQRTLGELTHLWIA